MPVAVHDAEPDQMLALKTAAAALDDAGGLEDVAHERIGVILGRGGYLTPALVRLDQRVRTSNQLLGTLRQLLPDIDDDRLVEVKDAFAGQLGELHPESAIGLVPNLAASRVANRLDLGGPAYTIDAACASSLIAVDSAVAELASGPLRRRAGRRRAPLPRRHPVVGLLPARGAQRIGSDPTVQPSRRRHPDRRGHRRPRARAARRRHAPRPSRLRHHRRHRRGQRRARHQPHEPAGRGSGARARARLPRRRGRSGHRRPGGGARHRDQRRRPSRAGHPPPRLPRRRARRRAAPDPGLGEVQHRSRHAGRRGRRSHQGGAGRAPRCAAPHVARRRSPPRPGRDAVPPARPRRALVSPVRPPARRRQRLRLRRHQRPRHHRGARHRAGTPPSRAGCGDRQRHGPTRAPGAPLRCPPAAGSRRERPGRPARGLLTRRPPRTPAGAGRRRPSPPGHRGPDPQAAGAGRPGDRQGPTVAGTQRPLVRADGARRRRRPGGVPLPGGRAHLRCGAHRRRRLVRAGPTVDPRRRLRPRTTRPRDLLRRSAAPRGPRRPGDRPR